MMNKFKVFQFEKPKVSAGASRGILFCGNRKQSIQVLAVGSNRKLITKSTWLSKDFFLPLRGAANKQRLFYWALG